MNPARSFLKWECRWPLELFANKIAALVDFACRPGETVMNPLLKTKSVFLLTLAFVGMTASCMFTKGKEVGERAVRDFHNRFNQEQYHEIYTRADEGFRKAVSESEVTALFEAVHRKLGTVRNAQPTSWRVNATTSGTLINLQYATEFTEGKGTESFVFMVHGNEALLYNYNINSPTLITK